MVRLMTFKTQQRLNIKGNVHTQITSKADVASPKMAATPLNDKTQYTHGMNYWVMATRK